MFWVPYAAFMNYRVGSEKPNGKGAFKYYISDEKSVD